MISGTPDRGVLGVESDTHLVTRARTGDADAFEELVRLHSGRVFRMLTRLLGSTADAEEVSQEVFVRIFRGLSVNAEANYDWVNDQIYLSAEGETEEEELLKYLAFLRSRASS